VRQLQAHPLSRTRRLKATEINAWVDGAARGNPGPAGFGALLQSADAGADIELAGFLGAATNNVAEYAGLLAALHAASEQKAERLTVHSDSLLLVRQLEGRYRVKAPHLQPLHARATALRRAIPRFAILHVPREENRRADALANLAIDERRAAPPWLLALLAGA
jgi:ribonuclease HI